ncbi:MAG: CoA transferase [Deltaproteobacteria bacterium]|nr:MAG: CoA transferase [Deltaproteobacteria bacterium]
MMKVLGGIRILDFSRYASGPVATMMLADMGAEVIRVEKPGGEDDRTLPPLSPSGTGLLFMNCSRHKKCITLNLRHEEAQGILEGLVKKADVVVHNFLPGTEQWKVLEYERLNDINPKIILAAVSGFGQDGPYSKRPGFDSVAQAMCGSMSVSGFPGNPPTRAQSPWVDVLTASHCTIGIMLALYERVKTGRGQMVDVSLLDSAVFASAIRSLMTDFQLNGAKSEQIGNNSHYIAPGNLFRAKDGWVMITAAVEPLWRRMVKEMGKSDLLDDQRFEDGPKRFENRDALNLIIGQWTGERTVDEILVVMERAHVPAGPVYTADQVINDPQVKYRKMLVDINYSDGNVLLSGLPIRLSKTPGKAEGPIAEAGEHNEGIYRGLLGLEQREISRLKDRGII